MYNYHIIKIHLTMMLILISIPVRIRCIVYKHYLVLNLLFVRIF